MSLASLSGFRASEAGAIQKDFFALDLSFVSLAGKCTKNDKAAVQPIPPGLRVPLAAFLSPLSAEAVLWPIADGDGVKLLRADAEGTGITIGRAGRGDRGAVLDFHSLRHTYISNLSRSGLSDTMRQKLARATGGIVQRYTHQEQAEVQMEADRIVLPDMSVIGVSVGVSGVSPKA